MVKGWCLSSVVELEYVHVLSREHLWKGQGLHVHECMPWLETAASGSARVRHPGILTLRSHAC